MSASTGLILTRTEREERDRWFSCTRKRMVYATRDRAERVAAQWTKHDRENKVEARPWNAYACKYCGSYHIGHERRVEPCGICDVPHPCHCPRMRSHCDDCLPLGAER